MQQIHEREQELEDAFSTALLQREFIPYIQPKYNIFEQKFYGGEVLCRWKHNGEMISPSEFIPVFEKSELITQLDRYMFLETVKIIHNWIRYQIEPVPLSVNLSRINFYNQNLTEEILGLLEEFRIPHNLIQIEITESAYTEVEQEVIKFVQCMRKNNIDILMDDFGSGYSSLNVLKDIDVSILKVDYRFLNESIIKNRREQILESVVKMARTIEVPIIVEGVEKERDVSFLKSLGVRYVQGFLYGKPMPLEEFEKIPHLNMTDDQMHISNELFVSNDIMDLTSPVYKIYEDALLGMGICEYKKGEIYFQQMNKTLRRSTIMSLLDMKHNRVNMFSFLEQEDRTACEDYIEAVCERNSNMESIDVFINTPIGKTKVRIRVFFLSKRGRESILLAELINLQNITDTEHTTDLFEILDKLDHGYYILDQNHTVLYSNAAARKLLPHFIRGVKCSDYKSYNEDCNQCPLDNYDKLLSYFSQNLDKYIENYTVEIKLNNQKVKLVRIDESSTKVLENRDSVMRMNKALTRDSDVYTEVDLDTLQYSQITFAKRKVFDIPAIGNYNDSYDDLIEKRIDPTTNQEVLEFFSGEAMRRNFADGKRLRARYKFAGVDAWAECVGTCIQEGEKRYCCVYTKDITDQIQKEYDSLTNLISGNSMKDLVNDYILEHASVTAVMFRIDFDQFRQINITYGYLYGDKVLKLFAKMIQDVSKRYNYVSRIGGDEFLIFAPDMKDADTIQVFWDNLNDNIIQLSSELKIDQVTGYQLGMAVYPQDGRSFDELYKKAEEFCKK